MHSPVMHSLVLSMPPKTRLRWFSLTRQLFFSSEHVNDDPLLPTVSITAFRALLHVRSAPIVQVTSQSRAAEVKRVSAPSLAMVVELDVHLKMVEYLSSLFLKNSKLKVSGTA